MNVYNSWHIWVEKNVVSRVLKESNPVFSPGAVV